MKKIFAVTILLLSGSLLFAQSPCSFKYGANETDSLKSLEQITNFTTFYKAKSYKDAYQAWQYLVNHCPCSWSGIYSNAQTMFDALIKVEKDSAQRERYIDTLLYSYDIRHTSFPDRYSEGFALGFKAYNTLRYRSKNYQQAYDWYVQSVELDKENTQPVIWDTYFQLAQKMTEATKDTTIVIDAYERATDYIDVSINNAYKKYDKDVALLDNLDTAYKTNSIDKMEYDKRLKALTEDTVRQNKFVDNYQKTLNKIEAAVTPYAPCNVLEEVYSKKLETNRDNISAVNKMVLTLAKGGCVDSPVFKEALGIAHKASPNTKSAYLMGNLTLQTYLKDKNSEDLNKAIDYYNEAISLSETNEQKVDAYYMLGLAYQIKGAYSESRSAAYSALKIRPNMGKAYILIGDLYANSGGRCSGDDIPLGYAWAAADKYSRAASVDPSCASQANAQRSKLRFPTKEEYFVRGMHPGDSYHVGCWIQENTTVR